MFKQKPASQVPDDHSAQGAELQISDLPPRPEPVHPAAATGRGRVAAPAAKPSLISEGFAFKGDMKSDGSLTVDGAIHGDLVVRTLLIGATGVVDGSVKADSITVEGSLSGAVECKELMVGGRARVDGKLNYATIAIQRGGTIKGELKRA